MVSPWVLLISLCKSTFYRPFYLDHGAKRWDRIQSKHLLEPLIVKGLAQVPHWGCLTEVGFHFFISKDWREYKKWNAKEKKQQHNVPDRRGLEIIHSTLYLNYRILIWYSNTEDPIRRMLSKEHLVITVISFPPHYSANWWGKPTFHCFPIAF